nr:hypothetical protein CFP56_37332 [Quercus suber]
MSEHSGPLYEPMTDQDPPCCCYCFSSSPSLRKCTLLCTSSSCFQTSSSAKSSHKSVIRRLFCNCTSLSLRRKCTCEESFACFCCTNETSCGRFCRSHCKCSGQSQHSLSIPPGLTNYVKDEEPSHNPAPVIEKPRPIVAPRRSLTPPRASVPITVLRPLNTTPSMPVGTPKSATTGTSKNVNGVNSHSAVFSPPGSPSPITSFHKRRESGQSNGFSRMSSLNYGAGPRSQLGGGNKMALVQDSALTLKRKSMSELGAGVSQSVDDTTFIGFVEWIRSERLQSLPHKGSKWDSVLIRALYFAERLHQFDNGLQNFAHGSSAAANIGFGHARLLLQLGHENSAALDQAFGFFYKASLSVAGLLDRVQMLSVTSETQEQLCLMYTDLLTLVVEVAIRFYKTVNGMVAGSVSLDLYDVFSETIETFRLRRIRASEAMWTSQIESEGLDSSLSIEVLSKWLAPNDRVLEMLGSDHTTFTDAQAEFTCLWFQDTLTRFVKSTDDEILLINGRPGSGKTTLAGAICERLQRPVARKTYSTIFCAIGTSPTQATTLHVAYEQASRTSDPKAYEEHLWTALGDALKHPLDQAHDTVLVIDGLDEVQGGQASMQALFSKLTQVVTQGKRTKLVALSQSLSLPSGVRGVKHDITLANTRDDVHAVAIRSLAHNSAFTSKPGPEQENILANIIQAADGSFLWTILFTEAVKADKTPDAFTKALQMLKSSPPTVVDLVSKLLSVLQPTNESKLLLAWLVDAARPFTYDELDQLFSINPEKGTTTDRQVDVHQTVQSIRPLLSVTNDVVRVRHSTVQTTVRSLIDQSKLPLPIKDRRLDILVRLLTYAKAAVPEKGEPTFDNSDFDLPARLFSKHHLLEYVIRYQPHHFQLIGVTSSTTGDIKLPTEVQKAYPDSTVVSILQWLCWDDQFPGAEEVDLHILTSRIARQVLGENHPVVLQSYISAVTYYDQMNNRPESAKLYYLATTIAVQILSNFHPVTVECGTRYLRVTGQVTDTSRTTVVSQYERILIILIAAYERQYGTTSDVVVQARQSLVQLYTQIKEESKAQEIVQLIHGTTVEKYGRDSEQARDLNGSLRVSLGKSKNDKSLDTYDRGIFTDHEDEEEEHQVLELGSIAAIVRQAEQYAAQKHFELAEQTYVELWQALSERCRTTLSTDWHEKKIDTVNAYSKFLKSQKRESETSALLICLAQEYQHHELSYSENVISRLTESAQTLKSVGHHSAALSIFRQASSYYKSTRKEQSRSFSQIEEEISITSQEVLKHATSASTLTEQTKSVSESSLQSTFEALISTQSKTIEASTLTIAKQLTTQYIEQRRYSEATTVINSTLSRTWSSFLSSSAQQVTLTETFLQESVSLVEQLAECYMQQRLFERVEDVYIRLFRAALTSPQKHKDLLEKAKTLLVQFYDKHGYPDRAIGVFQEVLSVYRRIYGANHEIVIRTLYELGSRCRTHARTHVYWVDYYQQIVTALNKDSDVCNAAAFEASMIVANSYWEERRHAEAVTVFTVLWNTFIRNRAQYKQFEDAKFSQILYERYTQSLESVGAEYEKMYQVTKQWRETSQAAYGASSAVAVEATLSFARVASQSEAHLDEAISHYEMASKSTSATSATSSSNLSRSLTTLYKRRIASSSSASSETVARAASMYQEQLATSQKSYGYAHESTLNSLREVSMLHVRQQKSDLAVKELTTAVVQINQQQVSEEQMLESAKSIAQTFQACQQTQKCEELVQELHRQLIAKDIRKSSSFSFDLTKSSSSSLVFLAALEYNIRKDTSLTFSEILADIRLEYIHFEHFRRVMNERSDLDKILIAAAPLRYFLLKRGRKDLAASLEDQALQLFIKRDTAGLKLLSPNESPRVSIIGILDSLGNRKSPNFVRAVILASNRSLSKLIEQNKFAEAYDIANIAFLYAQHHHGYHGAGAISRGFELASYLDGRGENRCPDEKLRKQLLQLSNNIIKEILSICKQQKINMAQVQLAELSQIIALLGEQGDYETLESLLTSLWNTRDAQRSWPSEVLLNLGQRLIAARYLAGHPIKALRLAEDIAYNLRRVHGNRHPAVLDAFTLLAQLYTSTGQHYQNEKNAGLAAEYFKKSIVVHEDVLRWLVSDGNSAATEDDDDDEDTAAAILAEHGVKTEAGEQDSEVSDAVKSQLVKTHLVMLRNAYQRLGSWPKEYAVYERLNAAVYRKYSGQLSGVEGVEKWTAKGFGAGKSQTTEGSFVGISDWEILPKQLRV